MPVAAERLSDHSPVVVEIQDRDLDRGGVGTTPMKAHAPIGSGCGSVKQNSAASKTSRRSTSVTSLSDTPMSHAPASAVSSALANHSACLLHSNTPASIPVHTHLHD